MIKKLIANNKVKEAYEELMNMHPHDQAEFFRELSYFEKERIYIYLKDDELSEILSYMDPDESAEILSSFDLTKQKYLIEQMEIDDAVDLIEELKDYDKEQLLDVLEDAEEMKTLLEYDEDLSGALMTSDFVEIDSNLDVKDAMKIVIEKAPEVETIKSIFITNNKQYLGTVSLNKLIKAKSPTKIYDILEKSPQILDTNDIDMAIHLMREYSLYELAVCNEDNNLLGIITLDDAIEAYQEEATEDFGMLAGVSDLEERNILKSSIHRLPWLLILAVASIPIAFATTMFEEVILAVSLLALFQPLILDASGDVATQTLAVTLRKLNQTDGASVKEGFKEVLTGTINGFILGIVAGLITYFLAIHFNMTQPFMVSLVVSLSLWITVTIGPVLGFSIPVVLNKMKIDPAVASGPFITTLVDLISLIIYFGLATLLLGVA